MIIESKDYKCTRQEATDLLRAAPKFSKFYLYVIFDAPHVDDTETPIKNACNTTIRLSRNKAIELVSRMLMPCEEYKGARIPITLDPDRYYWIG